MIDKQYENELLHEIDDLQNELKLYKKALEIASKHYVDQTECNPMCEYVDDKECNCVEYNKECFLRLARKALN